MPLALSGRPKDAVAVLPPGAGWRDGVARFLRTITSDAGHVARHLDVLERRADGLRWAEEFADARLPDGRPMPPSRRYAETLVDEEILPLYDVDGLRLTLDLHNPHDEGGAAWFDPDRVEVCLVADVRYFSHLAPLTIFDPSAPFEETAARRAANGRLLGNLLARLVEATDAEFAYADIFSTGARLRNAMDPRSVVHPAPSQLQPWDYLWSITVWGPPHLNPDLERRLDGLELTDAMLKRIDPAYRPTFGLDRRTLATGARFLQYRTCFGTESRGERAAVDTPMAKALRLRSTNILYRG
jgi:hypothetical protein